MPSVLRLCILAILLALPAAASGDPAATGPRIVEDAGEVFRRAFWRQPDPADQLLHGLRREWLADDGTIRAWDWFIVLEASSATVEYLIGGSAFELVVRPEPAAAAPSAPEWFADTCEGCIQYAATSGNLVITIHPETRRIAAKDSGAGMRSAAPERATPPTPDAPLSSGRLPGHRP